MTALPVDLPGLLPDYLPILARIGRKSERGEALLETLRQRLAASGISLQPARCAGKGAAGGKKGAAVIKSVRHQNHLARALADHDLLLFDGDFPITAAWPATLALGIDPDLPNGLTIGPHFSCVDETGLENCAGRLISWLQVCRERTPLAASVLIGGQSSRMGRPKHLIHNEQGITWLERTVDMVRPLVCDLVLSGAGDIPGPLAHLQRVDDLPGIGGPLAGVGAVLKSLPFVSWLVLACDMPDMTQDCIRWLLDQRDSDRLAVIARNPRTGRHEPLCAWYDYRCWGLIEDLLASGGRKISELCGKDRIGEPLIPEELCGCWRNVNRPEEL